MHMSTKTGSGAQDPEYLASFVAESKARLSRAQNDLQAGQTEATSRIIQAVRFTKERAKCQSFRVIENLAFSLEKVFVSVFRNQRTLNSADTAILNHSFDRLLHLIDNAQQSNEIDVSAERALLRMVNVLRRASAPNATVVTDDGVKDLRDTVLCCTKDPLLYGTCQ